MSILDRLEKSKGERQPDKPERYDMLLAKFNEQLIEDFHLNELKEARERADAAEAKLNSYIVAEATASIAINSLNEKVSSLESDLRAANRKIVTEKQEDEAEEKELKLSLKSALDKNIDLELQLASASGKLSQAGNIKPVEVKPIPSFEFDTVRDGRGMITKVTAKPIIN